MDIPEILHSSKAPARRPVFWLSTLWLPVLAVLSAFGLAIVEYLVHGSWPYWMMDFHVYLRGANAVLDGTALFEVATTDYGLPFLYTPLSALLFVPFAISAAGPAALVWTAVQILCLELVVWMMLGVVGVHRYRAVLTLGTSAALLTLHPVDNHLSLGQINLLLMFLVLVDFLHGPGRRWHGVGIGAAAAIKLVPLVFVGYLLLTRQLRAATTAGATFLGAVAAGFLVLPADSTAYWTRFVFDADRASTPGDPLNQSVRSVLARLFADSSAEALAWLITATVLGCLGLAIAVALHRENQQTQAILVCALTATLISPVSWRHHWVWIVAVLILLAGFSIRGRSPWWAGLLGLSTAVFALPLLDWFVPLDEPAVLSPGQELFAAAYPLAGVVLVATFAANLRRGSGPNVSSRISTAGADHSLALDGLGGP